MRGPSCDNFIVDSVHRVTGVSLLKGTLIWLKNENLFLFFGTLKALKNVGNWKCWKSVQVFYVKKDKKKKNQKLSTLLTILIINSSYCTALFKSHFLIFHSQTSFPSDTHLCFSSPLHDSSELNQWNQQRMAAFTFRPFLTEQFSYMFCSLGIRSRCGIAAAHVFLN